jgi:hypothetical protein
MRFILIALLFVSSLANAASFFTGHDLAKWKVDFQKAQRKDTSADLTEAYKFRYYIIGISDIADGTFFCGPKDVSDFQVVSIVAKYIDNNPEQWNKPGSVLVMMALSKAFPCPEKCKLDCKKESKPVGKDLFQ